jgi:kynureninase
MGSSIWSVQYAIAADRRDAVGRFRDRFVFDEEPAIYLRGHLLGRLPKAAVGVMQGAVEETWGRRLERDWGAVERRVAEKVGRIVGAAVTLGEGLDGRDVTGEAGVAVLGGEVVRGRMEGFLCGGPGAPGYFSGLGDPGWPLGLAVAAAEPGLDLTLEAGVAALAEKARALGEYAVELVGDGAELGVGRVVIRQEGAAEVARVLEEEHRVMVECGGADRLVLGLAPLYTSFVEVREAVLRWRAVVRERGGGVWDRTT